MVQLAYKCRASGTGNKNNNIHTLPLLRIVLYKTLKEKKNPNTHITLCDHQRSEQNTDLLASNQVPVVFIRVVPKGPSQYLDSGGQTLSEHVAPQRAFRCKRGHNTRGTKTSTKQRRRNLHPSAKCTSWRLNICFSSWAGEQRIEGFLDQATSFTIVIGHTSHGSNELGGM